MMQCEGTRMTLEDKKELAAQIKELELKVQNQRDNGEPAWEVTARELRRLRRIRDQK